ncbi:MAG TPA: redox-sensing transcriptional repressor Rex, partial [Gemmatimonadales bacterium]|nr:redox-sensing transcriptional repressor Rex [Gemmatimonadales bacterium]
MPRVADSTIRRLSLYLRLLEEFAAQGIETVSSEALAGRGGTTSAQVRKDLSFFGSFGKRGLGYAVPELMDRLRDILGLKRRYRVGMVGAGKIGSALLQYHGFRQRGFDIAAIFDVDPAKIGTRWNGLTVQDVATMEEVLGAAPVDMAVLVTPAD